MSKSRQRICTPHWQLPANLTNAHVEILARHCQTAKTKQSIIYILDTNTLITQVVVSDQCALRLDKKLHFLRAVCRVCRSFVKGLMEWSHRFTLETPLSVQRTWTLLTMPLCVRFSLLSQTDTERSRVELSSLFLFSLSRKVIWHDLKRVPHCLHSPSFSHHGY